MNKNYLAIVFVILIHGAVNAQKIADSNSEKVDLPHLFWGFSLGTGQFGLHHDNKDINISNGLSFRGGLFFELQINRWISAEIGGYYSVVSANATLSDYEASFENVDDMGVDYLHMVNAYDVEEEMNAKLLEIPVSVKLLQRMGNWSFYLKPGISYTAILNSDYYQRATIGISGHYPHYNVTYDDVPQHGYFVPTTFKSRGELALKNSLNPFIGSGVIVAGKGKTGVFFIEGKYYPGIINFSNNKGNGIMLEGPLDNKEIGSHDFESITQEGTIYFTGFIVSLGFRF